MDDRRKYYRVKDDRVKVIYKAMDPLSKEHKVSTVDLSAGGMCLALNEKIKLQTLLEISIILPDDNEPLLGLAKVVWQKEEMTRDKSGRSYYETGVGYLKLGFQNRKRIAQFISSYLARNPGSHS